MLASTPATGPPTPTPSPPMLDATYYANVAANQFKVNQQTNNLAAQIPQAQTALQGALAKLAYQQPRDQLAAMQAANKRGALYSTVYNQQLGDIGANYYGQRQAAQTEADTRIAGLLGQINDLQQGNAPGGPYDLQQRAESAQRVTDAAMNNPGFGQPGIGPPVPAPKPPPSGGHYVNVNGKWQLIHATGPNQWAPGPPAPASGGHYVRVGNQYRLIHAVGPNKWAPGPPTRRR